MIRRFLIVAAHLSALILTQERAHGAITIPSDGSDGAFSVATDTVIDLSEAVTGTWSDPSPQPGKGIYDPEKWAVVFKYSSVSVQAPVTFVNHPSGAPVVWLVQGNVSIGSLVTLDGAGGDRIVNGIGAPGGPGGFSGGHPATSTNGPGAGLGPGGSNYGALGGGSFATSGTGVLVPGSCYGNDTLIPLIGGSGGSGFGGGGGGAILIAASDSIQIDGAVAARGGGGGFFTGGGGSGGAIRLVADTVSGSGNVIASPGDGPYWYSTQGGLGRIRIDCNSSTLNPEGEPEPVYGLAGSSPQIWPDGSTPAVTVTSVHGRAVPTDPRAYGIFPGDVTLPTTGTVTMLLQTQNVPSSGTVTVRVAPLLGPTQLVPATFVSGDITSATWSAAVALPGGVTNVQAHAVVP